MAYLVLKFLHHDSESFSSRTDFCVLVALFDLERRSLPIRQPYKVDGRQIADLQSQQKQYHELPTFKNQIHIPEQHVF